MTCKTRDYARCAIINGGISGNKELNGKRKEGERRKRGLGRMKGDREEG